ncbi:hypothetical protein CPC08DRAFT_816257 [Agrocybe pediades]|nr:hypothetical protein CPC08DRAFT_816257 [Agrocybe pediades]
MLITEKQKRAYPAHAHTPLKTRPLDLLYFLFFAMHLPATLLIDLQYIYPTQLVPNILKSLVSFYVDMSRDPLIGGINGFFFKDDNTHMTWFKTFIVLEAVFQVPVFVLGLRGLYKGSKSIYPLLAVYAASSATTTLACLTTVLTTPELTPELLARGAVAVSDSQRFLLLSSYVPFFLIPLIMAVDMTTRVTRLVKKGVASEEESKKWN